MKIAPQAVVRIVISFMLFVVSNDAMAQQLLSWKFAKGDRFDIKMVQTTQSTAKVADKDLSLVMQTAIWMSWKTTSVDDDGHAVLSSEFTRVATKTTTPDGQRTLFDSEQVDLDNENSASAYKAVRPLLNSRTQITMAPWGEIEKVVTSAETQSLLGDLPALAQIKKLLTTEGLNQTLRQSLGVFPVNEVNVNDVWESQSEVKSPSGMIRMSSQFTYKGLISKDGSTLQQVAVKTRIQLPDDESSEHTEKQVLEQTGTYWFDAERGHLARSQLDQQIRADATLIGDQNIRVDTKSLSVLEIHRP